MDVRVEQSIELAPLKEIVRAYLAPANAFKQLPVWKRDDRDPTVCLRTNCKNVLLQKNVLSHAFCFRPAVSPQLQQDAILQIGLVGLFPNLFPILGFFPRSR